MEEIRFAPSGDSALVAEFGTVIDDEINEMVHAMGRWITKQKIRGVTQLLPTFRSLMVFYDPMVISYERLVRKLRRFSPEQTKQSGEEKQIIQVPCCYDGPDMEDMQRLTHLSQEEIVKIHCGTVYKIYMMGFLPGFVYLGGLDPRLCVPRLATPRTRIEPGSVGIGGSQTGVYPVASPGGWRILGRTPIKFYDPRRTEPILCRSGQYIQFVPISREEYERMVAE